MAVSQGLRQPILLTDPSVSFGGSAASQASFFRARLPGSSSSRWPHQPFQGSNLRRAQGCTPCARFHDGYGSSSTGADNGRAHHASSPGSDRESTKLEDLLGQDYYKLLGVPRTASPGDVRRGYWHRMKSHHPDVAGDQGHDLTLLLNEAYETLIDDGRRTEYDRHWQDAAEHGYIGFTGRAKSKWKGAQREEALFVDENACIGCQECVFHAGGTFMFDQSSSTARIHTQGGDPPESIKTARLSCPVDCIHTVQTADLPVLEFLMEGYERPGDGPFGQGWYRAANVFKEGRDFSRKLSEMRNIRMAASTPASGHGSTSPSGDSTTAPGGEDPGAWWKKFFVGGHKTPGTLGREDVRCKAMPWQRMFGRAEKKELLQEEVEAGEVPELVHFVQQWAATIGSSSELPLPMDIKVDQVHRGVAISFMTVSSMSLVPVGHLLVSVDPIDPDREISIEGDGHLGSDVQESDAKWAVRITRHNGSNSGALPGENRVLVQFRSALRLRGSPQSYEAYHIKAP